VLKHWGVPEFNPPLDTDENMLKGDHIVTFKVLLPNYDKVSADYKAVLD
jgi:hypothetical protein